MLILDVGTLMGSLVGQTEERTRLALQIADAMAPCVVMIDEVEKAFAHVEIPGSNPWQKEARRLGRRLYFGIDGKWASCLTSPPAP